MKRGEIIIRDAGVSYRLYREKGPFPFLWSVETDLKVYSGGAVRVGYRHGRCMSCVGMNGKTVRRVWVGRPQKRAFRFKLNAEELNAVMAYYDRRLEKEREFRHELRGLLGGFGGES